MKCTNCGSNKSTVVDSRPETSGLVKRRRECLECGKRFVTYEVPREKWQDINQTLTKFYLLEDVIKSLFEVFNKE